MHRTFRVVLCCAVLLATLPAAAQKNQPVQSGALNPAAPAPVVKYESSFAGYNRYRDEALADWRSLNEEVARAGGHVGILGGAGHAGHAAKPGPTPPATGQLPPETGQPPVRGTPQAPGHAGH